MRTRSSSMHAWCAVAGHATWRLSRQRHASQPGHQTQLDGHRRLPSTVCRSTPAHLLSAALRDVSAEGSPKNGGSGGTSGQQLSHLQLKGHQLLPSPSHPGAAAHLVSASPDDEHVLGVRADSAAPDPALVGVENCSASSAPLERSGCTTWNQDSTCRSLSSAAGCSVDTGTCRQPLASQSARPPPSPRATSASRSSAATLRPDKSTRVPPREPQSRLRGEALRSPFRALVLL